MVRFYLIPVISPNGIRGPKYLTWRGGPAAPLFPVMTASFRDYGQEPTMLVAIDIADADDLTLSSQVDVTKFSDNLDTQLQGRLATMQAAIEALNIPGDLLTVNTTDRQVIRGIMGVFAVAQCMQGAGYSIFAGGLTLTSTVGQIPAAPRQALMDCCDRLNYDRTGITGASTIRQILVKIAQQAAPSPMLGVTV